MRIGEELELYYCWAQGQERFLDAPNCIELIQSAVKQGLGRMTRYFCQLLGVSRSGYYNYLKSSDKRLARIKADEQAGALIKKAFHRRGFKKGSRSIKMTFGK